ncbi:hypothetical protein Tco_0059067 [Tanacetum coccineum]
MTHPHVSQAAYPPATTFLWSKLKPHLPFCAYGSHGKHLSFSPCSSHILAYPTHPIAPPNHPLGYPCVLDQLAKKSWPLKDHLRRSFKRIFEDLKPREQDTRRTSGKTTRNDPFPPFLLLEAQTQSHRALDLGSQEEAAENPNYLRYVSAAYVHVSAVNEDKKGVIRFGKRGKLNPRYIGPFKILKRVGPMAYTLELPEELSSVHSTFHVYNLKKCLSDESLVFPMKELRLDDTLNFMEEPVEIMDREVKQLSPKL